MRDSIGGAWLLGLVATFVLLFTAFLAVAINYTKAFKVKNEIIDFIEREEGLTDRINKDNEGAIQLISNYLRKSGYNSEGKCDTGWIGVSIGDASYDEGGGSTKFNFCVKKHNGYDYSRVDLQKAYYEVRLFFEFNIPIFGDIFTYKVNGSTIEIMYPADCDVFVDSNCSPR